MIVATVYDDSEDDVDDTNRGPITFDDNDENEVKNQDKRDDDYDDTTLF